MLLHTSQARGRPSKDHRRTEGLESRGRRTPDALLENVVGFFKKALKVAVVLFVVASVINVHEHFKQKPIEPMTPQRRASHRIKYDRGSCTGTAIGPHAILTASHCNKDESTDTIHLDLSVKDFHIEKTLTDGRDHDIYLVDATLTNFVPYKVRPSKMGEHTHLYGSGGGEYPPERKDGFRVEWDDPSDIDAADGIVHFTEPVIPGDSGSAVFNDDGTIAAVTTYLYQTDSYLWGLMDDPTTAVDFTPAFTAEQIKEATEFQPTPYVASDKPVK